MKCFKLKVDIVDIHAVSVVVDKMRDYLTGEINLTATIGMSIKDEFDQRDSGIMGKLPCEIDWSFDSPQHKAAVSVGTVKADDVFIVKNEETLDLVRSAMCCMGQGIVDLVAEPIGWCMIDAAYDYIKKHIGDEEYEVFYPIRKAIRKYKKKRAT